MCICQFCVFFFQAEDGIRDWSVTGVQTCALPISFAEEHGFVGALGVMLLYFVVLMRLTQNAQTAPDRAGTFVVMGVVAVLSFHILVNIGMVVGFMPVTGIPLPLMSYGGSSVLFMFLWLGIVMNVFMRRFLNLSRRNKIFTAL